jgi:outer membrane biosynthesis protein TonB
MEEKMIEQAPVEEKEPEPKPADDPPPALGTGIKGDGPPDGFGLSGSGNGGRIGGDGSGSGRGGGKWDSYARQVQSKIADALRKNRKSRAARISALQVRIWPDSTGRITRAVVSGSTGDAALDAAIQNEVLTGLQLSEPPPQGMPSPIVLRLTARRPN